MNTQEIILDMIERQKKLDEAMYGSNNASYDMERTRLALMDELGELNHELKGDWCWWKKTQAPVDREKVLGELADAWHFALNIFYHEYPSVYPEMVSYYCSDGNFKTSVKLSSLYGLILDLYQDNAIMKNMVTLTKELGFTMEELYEAYKAKNEINYQRIASNY